MRWKNTQKNYPTFNEKKFSEKNQRNFLEMRGPNNLKYQLHQKGEELKYKKENAMVMMNNIEDIFKYFNDLERLFGFFKNMNKSKSEDDSHLEELMKNLG